MKQPDEAAPAPPPAGAFLDKETAEDDLVQFYGFVVEKCESAINYYRDKKKPKRFWAQFVRLFSIIFFSLAGLFPLADSLGAFDGDQNGVNGAADSFDSGQISLLLAGVAAALIGMDKFFGLSSSWTRFVAAELELQRLLDRFRLEWARSSSALSGDDEERRSPLIRLGLLTRFAGEVDRVNEDETKIWINEYQTALATLDKSTRDQRDTLLPGAIQVTVDRSDDVTGPIDILLDGVTVQSTHSDTAALRHVSSGAHEVMAIGADEEESEIRASQIVVVPAGGTSTVRLELG